jgi:phage FluMu protein Com
MKKEQRLITLECEHCNYEFLAKITTNDEYAICPKCNEIIIIEQE